MRPKRLMLSAVTKVGRHQVMADINDAVIGAGGWVVNHTLYANLATVFQLMMPAHRVVAFLEALEELHVRLDSESLAQADVLRGNANEDELPLCLNVTFIHNEPDLRREVPAVPG